MDMTRRTDQYSAALAYASAGWSVFPCHAPADNPSRCTCGHPDCASPAKHPRVAGGLKAATRDIDQISTWWRRWPFANVAIRTGAVSGLVVVDVDPRHGGVAALEALRRDVGVIALETLTVETGGGGQHLYFRHPGGIVRNDVGRKLGAGLDVRGDGGYVLAPPSRHHTGGYYEVGANRSPAALPARVARLLADRPPVRTVGARVETASHWAAAAVRAEVASVRHARPGSRNNTLVRAAFKLGQVLSSGDLDEATLRATLLDASLAAGLSNSEALATIASGMNAGTRHPRGPAQSGRDIS